MCERCRAERGRIQAQTAIRKLPAADTALAGKGSYIRRLMVEVASLKELLRSENVSKTHRVAGCYGV